MSEKKGGEKPKKTVQRKKAPTDSDTKADVLEAPEPETDLDQLGELPRSYGSDTIFLVAQEPHWLFTYWDIDISRHPGGPTFLRAYQDSATPEAEIEVPFETRNWYIPVKVAGGQYAVEIGYYRGNAWNVITRSQTVQTPPDRVSGSAQFDCATIPLHLSFQRLIDTVQESVRQGETLTQALAEAQKNGRFPGFAESVAKESLHPQNPLLEALLGRELLTELSSGSFSSAEIESRIREHLQHKLSSQAGGSEFLAGGLSSGELSSGSLAARTGLSSGALSSGALSSGALSSESLSSGALSSGALSSESLSSGALSSFSLESLTSGQWGPIESSLFAALTAFASGGETASWSAAALASWATAELTSSTLAGGGLGSWSGGASWSGASSWTGGSSWGTETSSILSNYSSGEFAALSSWLESVKSSWFQAAQSSWSAAALSSWNQATLTSWAQAAQSSWSGASETLSSWGQERKFFMHVNAEVIFYGGTDPRAKVTVDGKPIQLNPDGTFRYHFIFPDGTYEIPIVATSPDGKETRSATLRLERDTHKSGHVTDTAQPPLGAPMGSKF